MNKNFFEIKNVDFQVGGKIKINRTKYGITYKSASFSDKLKNKAIHDEFELDLHIVY